MYRRVAFAHTPETGQVKWQADVASGLFKWPEGGLRGPRWLRRWGSALFALQVPHGLGASAAALFLLASVSYGAVRGGHMPDIVVNLQDLCDTAANSLGLGITEIALAGERHVGRAQILKTAGITGRSSLLFLDASEVRARLLENPWIEQATVLKLYPGRLRLDIKERQPFALWQKAGVISVIAEDGTVLETHVAQQFASLPLVVGEGAERAAPELLALVARYPAIAHRVGAAVFVAERRWNLHLNDGVEVLLPDDNPERALQALADLDRTKNLFSRDITVIDLRLSDRVTVRQSEAAAEARDAALKATQKNVNKKKGSEA